jgi:hypothetical protein
VVLRVVDAMVACVSRELIESENSIEVQETVYDNVQRADGACTSSYSLSEPGTNPPMPKP